MSGRSVPSQLDQVLPRFSVQKPGPYHPFGRIRIAPFGKGVLRILGESAYNREKNREFLNFGRDRGLKHPMRPMISEVFEPNSLLNGTGNFLNRTGNFDARTGNLNRRMGFSERAPRFISTTDGKTLFCCQFPPPSRSRRRQRKPRASRKNVSLNRNAYGKRCNRIDRRRLPRYVGRVSRASNNACPA